jgi:ankyrin repeat protein
MLIWRLWISVGILVFCTVVLPAHAAQPEDNLLESALTGSLDAVSRALSNGADIDAANQRGSTALMLAASNSHLPVAKLLLSKGASVNATTST